METISQKLLQTAKLIREAEEKKRQDELPKHEQRARVTVDYIIKEINDNLNYYASDHHFKGGHEIFMMIPIENISNGTQYSDFARFVRKFLLDEGLVLCRINCLDEMLFNEMKGCYPPMGKYAIHLGLSNEKDK